MKKNFSLAVVLLAAVLAGCDGGPAGESSDAGERAEGGAARADSRPAAKPDGGFADQQSVPYCQVPSLPYEVSGSVPAAGYQWLANAVACDPYLDQYLTHTSCANVDGFTVDGSQQWCCVLTETATDSRYAYAVGPTTYPDGTKLGSLLCYSTSGATTAGQQATQAGDVGYVALCTLDGVFAGWECQTRTCDRSVGGSGCPRR